MCATYFGLFLGNPQARQYKNNTKEDCTDMTEDGLSTERNMQHTYKGNQLN
jgi:hypothetical protein